MGTLDVTGHTQLEGETRSFEKSILYPEAIQALGYEKAFWNVVHRHIDLIKYSTSVYGLVTRIFMWVGEDDAVYCEAFFKNKDKNT